MTNSTLAKARDETGQAVSETREDGVLDSLLRLNEGWVPAYGAPAPIEICRAAVAEAEARLVPVDPRYVAVELDRTMSLWKLPDNWEGEDGVASFYIEVLEDAPVDLVDLALRRLRSNHGYENFPKPGDLRRGLREELNRRWADLYTAKQMLFMAENAPPEPEVERPTEEQKARVDEILRPIKEAAAQREAEERERTKPTPRRVDELRYPNGTTRLESGQWYAYPADGRGEERLGPFAAAVDAQKALPDLEETEAA